MLSIVKNGGWAVYMTFDQFFLTALGNGNGKGIEPHDYQKILACGERSGRREDEWLSDSRANKSMLIDIPTGMGKTAAVVLAWLWNRVSKKRDDWPRRLVYCLPMRTLVEQTRRSINQWLRNLNQTERVKVHVLMGGEDAGEWDIHPERDAILVGTQDMLLSQALNRGYGMSRYRWPMHFGLLNNDCLWVMDEVQLMGPGLWTSAQLDWMRSDRFKSLKPCATWWMSATIRPEFLDTLDRKNAKLPKLTPLRLSDHDKKHSILKAHRPCEIWKEPTTKRKRKHASAADRQSAFVQALANTVVDEHRAASLSLVVCNTVAGAQRISAAIKNIYKGSDEVVLLTSRFRPEDREKNQLKLLDFEEERKRAGKDSSITVPGLICVSTQVIEAGVDVSAQRLWSEVAPWPSIIQRLGRLNRDGRLNGDARAFFWKGLEKPKRGARLIGPYDAEAVKLGTQLLFELVRLYQSNKHFSAREALAQLSVQKKSADKMRQALTPTPEPFPRAIDVHGLFSTEPDIFGGFTDVSPYIRSQDENPDVTIFWREWRPESQPRRSIEMSGPSFRRDEGCPVAVGKLREFLGESARACVWDDKIEAWQATRALDICPGMLVMLHRSDGGYSDEMGWTGSKSDKLHHVPPPGEPYERFEDERFSESGVWVKLGDHLNDAKDEAVRIVEAIELDKNIGATVIYAASEHDIGKALPKWQGELPTPPPQSNEVWAKAPYQFAVAVDEVGAEATTETILRENNIRIRRAESWAKENVQGKMKYEWHTVSKVSRNIIEQIRATQGILRAWNVPFRPGLRHEAATALALWHSYYRQGNRDFTPLSIYLAATHHGKVRTVLTARTPTGQDVCGIEKTTISLPWKDMPLDFECAVDGASGHFSTDGSEFIFEAPGWTGLVNDLLGGWENNIPQVASSAVPDSDPRNLGPFGLAYLETLVRCSDERASKHPSVKKDINS